MNAPAPPLAALAELTHRCPLQCPYCSNPLELERARGELDTEAWQRVIGEIAEPRAASLVRRARVFASVEGIDYGTYFAAYRVAEQRLAATAGSGAEAGVE